MDMTMTQTTDWPDAGPEGARRESGSRPGPRAVPASARFGRLTFGREAMAARLSKSVCERLLNAIDLGEPLDPEIASDVAHAMKEWAVSMGATHFCRWFQPQRGCAAEKHDSFLSFGVDGAPIDLFSGRQLSSAEPDASSFTAGGMRSTFEARGYTAWDPGSPAFIMRTGGGASTLVIPSVYLSWSGEVLDRKTPLLRALRALEDRAYKMLQLFGNRSALHVRATMGPEQEYFLVPKTAFNRRPDLVYAGRTLMGLPPSMTERMDEQTLGGLKPRVLAFMADLDAALWERGIPAKTRHNETAPSQFEIAPIFEEANLAVDHNLQQMEIMRRVADEHGMAVLLHEKPFAGLNGSGKHLSWSLADSDGRNLLEPGLEPRRQVQFLAFLCAMLHGVNRYGALLRAATADAGNDLRLGSHEAPPPIISVYLGDFLDNLLGEIEKGKTGPEALSKAVSHGLRQLPSIARDNTDRNRTAPLAFTGDKFELRAAGASQNPAEAAMVLALIMAEGLDVMLERIGKRMSKSGDVETAALAAIKEIVAETRRVCFMGNSYSSEWQKEAARRGLPDAKDAPEAARALLEERSIELFERYAVMTEPELQALRDMKLESYCKTRTVELKTLLDMAETMAAPAVARHAASLGDAADAFGGAKMDGGYVTERLAACGQVLKGIGSGAEAAEKTLDKARRCSELEKRARLLADEGGDALGLLRSACDLAESLVEHSLWPMPKTRDLLFML